MSLIRGVLLAGRFRTHQELNAMSRDDQRNTLIVELTNHSNQTNYQSFSDATLAGMGAAMVFLRETGIRDDRALKRMSADDQRNVLIVVIDAQTRMGGPRLQAMSNMELVLLGLGNNDSLIRGVLLAGKFRGHQDLIGMSLEDQRNTLITELSGRSNQHDYQRFDNTTLAGMGAVLVFLRTARIRDDAAIRTMTSDDQRNTLIVEIDGQVHVGQGLQGLSNMDLVRVGLGGYPTESMHRPAPGDLKPGKPEEISSGEFRHEGPVFFISLDNNDTETLCAALRTGAGVAGSKVAVAVAAGGLGAFGGLWPVVALALAGAASYIETINRLGGRNGVDINGVAGTKGVIVTPRLGKLVGELIKAARIAVSGRTILEFVLAAASKNPGLATALDIPVAANIFAAVASGTPLGWAIALGVGLVDRIFGDEPNPDQHGGIHADRDRVESWESFWMGGLGEDTRVSILSWQGFFSARHAGGGTVFANRPEVKEWETWRLFHNPDGTVSLQTFNGHFLVAKDGGGRECRADSSRIGPWEKFWLVNLPDGRIALKTHDKGKFVSVQRDL